MKNHRELAIIVSGDNKMPPGFDVVEIIKAAGSQKVFIQLYKKDGALRSLAQIKRIRELSMEVIFAHLDYLNINSIWEEGEKGDLLVEEYKTDINFCEENKIPLVVMHLTIGTSALKFNELGLARIRKIVNYAKELDIKIAFENTRLKGYLEYVLGNITDNNVGICFDSGHCHAHFKDDFDFAFFKNRIFSVHLHDNHQTSDEHLIPFDGTVDWDWTMRGLNHGGYTGPVTLECVYDNEYLKVSPATFFKKAYEAGQVLSGKLIKP
jgi:sugar phosphate isomerase/epimerase